MLLPQLSGLTFYENGLNCQLVTRGFALEYAQQGWSQTYLASYYWSMHYQPVAHTREVGSVPRILAIEEAMLRENFGLKFDIHAGWDGSAEQLSQIQAANLAVIIPTDKHPFVKRFLDVLGTDSFLLLEVGPDELTLYGQAPLIPLLHELRDRPPFETSQLAAWIPGGAFGVSKEKTLDRYIGDAFTPFHASRDGIYHSNAVLREQEGERAAALQVLVDLDHHSRDPNAALRAIVDSTLRSTKGDLASLVVNKAAFIRQIFAEEAGVLDWPQYAFVKSQSVAVATLFSAMKLLPCKAETVQRIDVALHRAIELWMSALPILATKALTPKVVESLASAEKTLLEEILAAIAQSGNT